MSQNSVLKNILSFILRFGLSAALLIWLYTKIDVPKTGEVIKNADVYYLLVAFGIFLVINFVLLLRWFIYVRGLKLRAPFGLVTRYFFIGLFGNLFLPSAIGGDIIKIYGLCKSSDEKPKVVASVLLDRLSGFASIVIVAVLAYIFAANLLDNKAILFSIIALALLSIHTAVVLFNEKVYSFYCRVFGFWPKLQKSLMQMHYDIALLKGDYKPVYQSVGLSCLNQVMLAFQFYFTAKALHVDVAIQYWLIFVPLICVAATVPSIGGLGVREFGVKTLLGLVGIEAGVAVSISLLSFIFMVLVGLIGGVVYVTSLSAGRIQYHEPNAGADPEEAGG